MMDFDPQAPGFIRSVWPTFIRRPAAFGATETPFVLGACTDEEASAEVLSITGLMTPVNGIIGVCGAFVKGGKLSEWFDSSWNMGNACPCGDSTVVLDCPWIVSRSMNASALHSYHTCLLSVRRHMCTSSSELAGTYSGVRKGKKIGNQLSMSRLARIGSGKMLNMTLPNKCASKNPAKP